MAACRRTLEACRDGKAVPTRSGTRVELPVTRHALPPCRHGRGVPTPATRVPAQAGSTLDAVESGSRHARARRGTHDTVVCRGSIDSISINAQRATPRGPRLTPTELTAHTKAQTAVLCRLRRPSHQRRYLRSSRKRPRCLRRRVDIRLKGPPGSLVFWCVTFSWDLRNFVITLVCHF